MSGYVVCPKCLTQTDYKTSTSDQSGVCPYCLSAIQLGGGWVGVGNASVGTKFMTYEELLERNRESKK